MLAKRHIEQISKYGVHPREALEVKRIPERRMGELGLTLDLDRALLGPLRLRTRHTRMVERVGQERVLGLWDCCRSFSLPHPRLPLPSVASVL
jgi:hypothetical protein